MRRHSCLEVIEPPEVLALPQVAHGDVAKLEAQIRPGIVDGLRRVGQIENREVVAGVLGR